MAATNKTTAPARKRTPSKAGLSRAGTAEPVVRVIAKTAKKVPVEWLGENYLVRIPRSSFAMQMAKFGSKMSEAEEDPETMMALMSEFTQVQNQLVVSIFGNKADDVFARLEDPEDDADFEYVMDLATALSEADSENPPT